MPEDLEQLAGAEIKKLADEIRDNISQSLDRSKNITDNELTEMISEAVFQCSRKSYLGVAERRQLADIIFNSMRRLDRLQPIIDDKSITEIMINGFNKIFVEKAGRIHKLDIAFDDSDRLEDVIQTLVSKTNRAVNEASPIVDISLPDGSRVNIVLKPVALNGPIMTIRKFPEKPLTMEQLVDMGSLSKEAVEDLNCLVRAKYNIFICGGTGSGKTTFLNALSNSIPTDERIITIEDSAELQINSIDNIVRLETRNANTEGKGRITIRDLIKASLRMRPERIIVGEVRGEEALDMLQAMNTGHDGSLSTGHANSAADMLKRLETMVLSAAPLPLDAIRQQIASAIDIIIHLSRMRDKTRRVMEISEIAGYCSGQILLNPLYVFREESIREIDGEQGYNNGSSGSKADLAAITAGYNTVNGSLKRTDNLLRNSEKLRMAGIVCRLCGELNEQL